MNWKKIIKYSLAVLFILSVLFSIWINQEGKSMYGGLTQVVDHKQFDPQTGAFAIKNTFVLSPEGDRFIAGQTVLIQQNKIVAMDSVVTIPSDVTIIDGSNKYLIPGLIDAHVHLFQSPNDLLLYIANGVTDIRELIGEENHLLWKKQIEAGRVGPRMFVASPRLGTFGFLEGKMMEFSQGFKNIPMLRQLNKL